METIGKIRRYRLVEGKSIKAISRELRLSRNTVRRVLRERRRASKYERRTQPRPRLGAYVERLEGMLAAEEARSWITLHPRSSNRGHYWTRKEGQIWMRIDMLEQQLR